jgi:hypothetical protein
MIETVTSSAAQPDPQHRVPAADPAAIRACLPTAVAAEFDRNWEAVMDRAKAEQDLTLVHDFLARWRIMAHAEMTDAGSYFRLMEQADRAVEDARVGRASGGERVPGAQIKAMISARLAAQ